MRINIDIEVSAEEFPLATQILETLRSIATQPGQHAQQAQQAPKAAPVTLAVSPPPPTPSPTASAAPAVAAPAPAPAPTTAPAAAAPASAQVNPRVVATLKHLLTKLDQEGEPSPLDEVSNGINLLLQRPELGPPDQAFAIFYEVFTGIIFSPDLINANRSVVPFMNLLPRLVEPFKTQMRKDLIPVVLKHLTLRRAISVNRAEFFAQAEAFAALVYLEFVAVPGAVQTIATLLQKPENRCAAVTMLGKTVELCFQQLTEKCPEEQLHILQAALASVSEPEFLYDLNYIYDFMQWPRPPQAQSLVPTASFENGHQQNIFALAVDAARHQVLSSDKGGTVVLWDANGQAAARVQLTDRYACAMDLHAAADLLLLLEVDSTGAAPLANPPVFAAYDIGQGSLRLRGEMRRPQDKVVTCLRVMPGINMFVAGETLQKAGGTQEMIGLYDIERLNGQGVIEPTSSFEVDSKLITAVVPCTLNENTFLTAASDNTVLLWDRRQSARWAGRFGTPHADEGHFVTCMDSWEHLLLVGNMDKTITQYDFRSLSQENATTGVPPLRSFALDDSSILRLAIGSGPSQVAVSTFHGLYSLDVSGDSPVWQPARPFEDGREVSRYLDVKWATGQPVVYAGGHDKRVDMYQLH
ncbi:hypothetical protein WJX72_011057 [[Myrmecia] bisecta]|uniref:Guanine nucleotide-binding protein subunit beta-like protein n=1 Tax=[Myrmecia] bisecta TaxID=41462 RepID=A0AAW1PZE4_9CHLO